MTRNKNPTKWFQRKVSFLKKVSEKIVNTTKVITSCITLSCNNVKEPPFPLNPIRLAGTWKKYSNRAIPQLMRMIEISGNDSNHLNSRIFK